MTHSSPDPLVSVVMSVYNGERYLAEAIESILNQTFSDFEFIVINDGSTDQSGHILDQFQSQDSRIRVFHEVNEGLAVSLNKGLKVARGKFIARMDADDVALPRRLEKQIAYLEAHDDVVLLGAEVELFIGHDLDLGPRGHPILESDIRRRLLLGDGGALTHPAVVFKRDVGIRIGGYDPRFITAQDLDLFIRLSERGKVANLSDILLKWRQHEQSVSKTKSESWSHMKRMAIRGAIDRMGLEAYLEVVFPAEHLNFTTDNLSLFRRARMHGRAKTAARLLKLASKDPSSRSTALEIRIENMILRVWFYLRNALRRLRQSREKGA